MTTSYVPPADPDLQRNAWARTTAPDDSTTLGVGVIGFGYWGPNLVRNFADVPEARVVAVSDLRRDRLDLDARFRLEGAEHQVVQRAVVGGIDDELLGCLRAG